MTGKSCFALIAGLGLALTLAQAADHPPKHGTLGQAPTTPKKKLPEPDPGPPDPLPVAGKKPVVAITGESIAINGKLLKLPCEKKELVAALGDPDREASLANVLLTWDDFGMFAYVKPGTTRVLAISVAFNRDTPSFWPKKNFPGTLTVDGATVTTDSDPVQLNKSKKGKPFEKSAFDPDSMTIEGSKATLFLRKAAGRVVEVTLDASLGS